MMAGIRVCNIPGRAKERHIKIHFSKPEHGGGTTKKIYYPLLNNNAVIIFQDPDVVTTVLKHEQRIGEQNLHVERLPEYQIYSALEARLNPDASALLMATPNLQDEMKYNAEVTLQVEETSETCILKGNWYQLEWAWHLLNQQMQLQEVLEKKIADEKVHGTPMELGDESDEDDAGFVTPQGKLAEESRPRQSPVLKEIVDVSPRERRRQKYDSQDYRSLGSYKASIPALAASATSHSHTGNIRGEQATPLVSLRLDERQQSSSPLASLSYRPSEAERRTPEIRSPSSSFHSSSRSLEQEYPKTIGAPDPSISDDELDLTGIGHNVPPESVHSSLFSHVNERKHDANATFEQFSDLNIRSPTRPGALSPSGLASQSSKADREPVHLQQHEQFSSLPLGYRHSRMDPVADPDPDQHFSSLQLQPEVPVRQPAPGSSTEFDKKDVLKPSISPYSAENLKFDYKLGNITVAVMLGDLLKESTDGIVNAANMDLKHVGGVARAIENAAGPELKCQCEKYIQQHKYLRTGEVMHTDAGGRLRCSHVLHVAGPFWISEKDREKVSYQLTQTFYNCFKYAEEKLWLSSLALPAISTGVFNTPLDVCMKAFLDATLIFSSTQKKDPRLQTIRMLNNDPEATVTSIVMIQTLLEAGIDKLTAEALELYNKFEIKELNLPRGRQERTNSFSKTFTQSPGATWSAGLYEEKTSPLSARNMDGSRRRSSSHSRVMDRDPGNGYSGLRLDTTGNSSTTSRGREQERSVKEPAERPLPDYKKSTTSKSPLLGSGIGPAKSVTRSGLSPRLTESPRSTTKRPSTADNISRTAPPVKQSLTTLDESRLRLGTRKVTSENQSGKMKAPFGTDVYSTLSPKVDSRTSRWAYKAHSAIDDYSDDADDEDGLSTQSLPADLEGSSFREKFLLLQQPERRTVSETCSICLSNITNPKELPRCKHRFCRACIDEHFLRSKPTCPTCRKVYGTLTGDQPKGGHMTYVIRRDLRIPGHEKEDGAIEITYHIPDGKQQSNHPNPGLPYKGITRKCYLPNSREGKEVLRMLKKAFDLRLTFTIGESRTTRNTGVLTWNDIHHKTSVTGGATKFGYPDPKYLQRVKQELADKGIMPEK